MNDFKTYIFQKWKKEVCVCPKCGTAHKKVLKGGSDE